jgi:hypothetical protein
MSVTTNAPPTTSTILVSNISRYKDTPIYQDPDTTRFALWVPPAEFQAPQVGWLTHRVAPNEVGFLDSIAVRYYGAGYESLWWVLQQANGLLDPESEMVPGMVLLIPPRTVVQQFLSRLGNVQS